jgi:hypothetical protein
MTNGSAPSVDALVGLDLWAASNAAGTLTLQFGGRRKLPAKRDPGREVGDFALHVQCKHDATEHGTSLPLSQLLQRHGAMKVKSVFASAPGTFVLEFEGDVRLSVLGDPDAAADEQWRLFVPGGSSAHLVFAAGSLREE